MTDPSTKHNKKDFLSFVHNQDHHPSEELNHKVLNYIKNELSPSHKSVFIKLVTIQGFIGFLTLLLCPQFNFSLTNSYELFHFFHHKFGEYICMAICGSIFVGSGAIFASYLLKPTEVKKIKDSKILYYLSISSLSLSSFLLAGADIYLHLAAFWFIGATLSGIFFFEINRHIRIRLIQT